MGAKKEIVVDTLTLRFVGEDDNGVPLHELRAAHVAEVLQGIVSFESDFTNEELTLDGEKLSSELLVRPAKEGSFLLEIVRVLNDHAELITVGLTVTGVPSIASLIKWSTKSFRADVRDIDHLANGRVKVIWQDDTVDEIPIATWEQLNKQKRRRKRVLRQIMAPLSEARVTSLQVVDLPAEQVLSSLDIDDIGFVLHRNDYDAVRPDNELEEYQDIFEVEAQMSAIDFDNPTKWRVRTRDKSRSARVEDQGFLSQIANGLAIRKSDIFRLRIREDVTKKNGRTKTVWTVLKVESYRRSSSDDQ